MCVGMVRKVGRWDLVPAPGRWLQIGRLLKSELFVARAVCTLPEGCVPFMVGLKPFKGSFRLVYKLERASPRLGRLLLHTLLRCAAFPPAHSVGLYRMPSFTQCWVIQYLLHTYQHSELQVAALCAGCPLTLPTSGVRTMWSQE